MKAAGSLAKEPERQSMAGLRRFARRTRRWGRAARGIPRFAVAVGVTAVILMTDPSVRTMAAPALRLVLVACLLVFVGQWWMRIESERLRPAGLTPYLLSPMGVIDALAVLGIPAALLAGAPEPYLWLPGAIWILKPAGRMPGLVRLGRVFTREGTALAAVGVLFATIMLTAGAVLYAAEGPAQPTDFGTLARALWWETLSLTGSNALHDAPQTIAGRLAAGVLTIAFLGVFGLWTSLMATGFVAVSQRDTFLRNWDLISRVPLFRSLGPAAISEVANALRPWEAPERTVVFREGRPGDSMYFIVSGSVRVHTRPEPVVLTDGSFFGEMALLGDGVRSATISTVEPSSFLVLDVADFRRIMASNPELAAAIDAESLRRREEGRRAVHG
jgi:voltage-gated potassium channel